MPLFIYMNIGNLYEFSKCSYSFIFCFSPINLYSKAPIIFRNIKSNTHIILSFPLKFDFNTSTKHITTGSTNTIIIIKYSEVPMIVFFVQIYKTLFIFMQIFIIFVLHLIK